MTQQPSTGETGRVLKFSPRRRAGAPLVVPDLPVRSPNNAGGDAGGDAEADDYGHRMRMNLATLVVIALLVACGLWLADGMAEFRAAQECLTMGARGTCAAIRIPERHP
jgi:hypothetical protein